MEAEGFQTLGLKMGGLAAVHRYVIYRETGLLIFDGYTNELYFVALSPAILELFKSGQIGLSFDGRKRDYAGRETCPAEKTEVINQHFNLLRIENIRQLRKALQYAKEKYK